MKTIVSIKWLFDHLNEPDLIVLDVSLKSNIEGSSTQSEGTIPNSRFFDLKNDFTDGTSPFPNTIPLPQSFEKECRKLGISNDSKIVVFDNFGVYSSPRAWWLFRVMGHENIAVLDGGLPKWIVNGFPTTMKHSNDYESGSFKARYQNHLVVQFNDIVKNIDDATFCVVDARSSGRFNGIEPEPRTHLKSGSIPHSVNMHYKAVLDGFTYKSPEKLKQLFDNVCGSNKELVYSCGSGLTACIIMLAGQLANKKSLRIYDGSWTEWAERNALYS